MNKRSLLLLFIISFLCVIFTLNSLCIKYVDTKIDNIALKYKNASAVHFVDKYSQTNNKILSLKTGKKLTFALTVSCLFFFAFVTLPNYIVWLIFALFFSVYLIAYKLLLNNGIFISISCPMFSILTAKAFASAYNYNFKENVKQKFENVLGKYISKDITKKILKNNAEVELGGKKAQITVMFADIRGFTSLSETRKAEEVSLLLNEYFTELEPIIEKHNGVINKFIGDAVLVVFGDPTPDKNHALNAVKCAHELRAKVREIRERWIKEGKPKIDIGVGINTGEAFIGNVGSSNRFEYTVIGDTVNIASRIEDYNKICKTQILISENTYNKISQIVDVIKIREVSIKGKRQKINIYEVLRIIE